MNNDKIRIEYVDTNGSQSIAATTNYAKNQDEYILNPNSHLELRIPVPNVISVIEWEGKLNN